MRAAPVLVLTLLLGGCPGRACPTRPFTEAAGVMQSYRDMRRPVRVLRAEARVDRRDGDGRVRGTVLMFIERSDRVRFDAMTQFGPAAVLTSDGQQFALTDLQNNQFLTGPTCPANIERFLGLRFSGAEVTRLLLGESPRIEAQRRSMSCRDGRYFVTLEGAEGRRQELEFEVRESDLGRPPEEQRLRLRRSEVFTADGETEWRVTYRDFRFVADPTDGEGRGVVMPFTVRFEDPATGADTQVRFSEVDLNVEVPAGAFSQRLRPGLTPVRVGCP